MKLVTILAAFCLVSSGAFAKSICVAPATEVAQCTADAMIPFIPFVSICKAGTQYIMMMDFGAATTPGGFQVAKSETASSMVYTATDGDADNSTLEIKKGGTPQSMKAVLSDSAYGFNDRSGYTCTGTLE